MSAVTGLEAVGSPRSLWGAMSTGHRSALLIAGITLLAVSWQLRWGTIPDTSWLITVCERMLSGERLYADIYETNPPFTVWLYLPPVAAAKGMGIAPEILVQAWTLLAALAGLCLAGHVVRRAGFKEADRLFALAPLFYLMLTIYPGNAFSEREHIGMAFFLPLLALTAWRARVDAQTRPGYGLAALVGASGSVLLLVKPHYAVMVLAPALFVCWRQGSLRPILALEYWVIGSVCTTYLATVLIVHPEFVRDVYPVLADVYLEVKIFLPIVKRYCVTWLFMAFLCWRLWPVDRIPELASVALLASVAGLLPLYIQGKGWAYHAYPAFLCMGCALLCLWALPAETRRGRDRPGPLGPLMNPSSIVVILGVVASFMPFWVTQKPSDEIVAAIRGSTRQPTIMMIGSDIAMGHPLSRMVEGRWVSTHVSDWLGAFAVYLSRRAQREGNPAEAAYYDEMVNRYAIAKREEILQRRPDIINVRKDEKFWIDVLTERYGFGELMTSYRLLAEDQYMAIYLRKDYRPPNPLPSNADASPAETRR